MYESYPKFIKMVSTTTRPLYYAMLKFTSSGPVLDYAIIKFWRPHDNVMRNAYNVIAIFRSRE
jgi:hypothetical protein